MPGDRDRERRSRDDIDRDQDISRRSRDDRVTSSRRRRRSSSRSRDDSPRERLKREEDPPPRQRRRRDYSPQERSPSPYSRRARIKHEFSPPRRRPSSAQRSHSPEPWGSHQHDLAYDRANPRPKSPPKEKQKPNYGLSGLLAAATNTKNGTVLKYNEPSEARRTKGWRIYVFKDGKEIDVFNLDGQSSFLIGRDRTVYPCSKVCANGRSLIFLWIILQVQINMQ
jgi:smad nuclear-interacting protein 1